MEHSGSGLEKIHEYFPELTGNQLRQYESIFHLYKEWNEKINVISRKDIDELFIRHILHSLAIAKFLKVLAPGSRIMDMGTGGGFPGIPLAIFFPQCEFVLVDSIAKKIRVVEEVSREAGLINVTARCERVEKISGEFDFVVSRAVAEISKLMLWSKNNISPHHKNDVQNGWICLKGGDLSHELQGIHDALVIPISKWFHESFFDQKVIVYVKSKRGFS